MMVTCSICGKEFQRPPSRVTEHPYCSKQCYGEGKLGDSEAFWSRVQRGKPKDCWLWTGAVAKNGYGSLKHRRAYKYAHRVAWELTYGPIPDGLFVMHKCDVKLCCNLLHLAVGSHQVNMRDMVEKGRSTKGRSIPQRGSPGEQHLNASFTNEQAELIRQYVADGVPQAYLAREYGVHYTVIYKIVHNITYRSRS